MAKTQEEIEYLKRDWSSDPIWDIEETEGFEEHREELKAFRLQKEAEWEQRRAERLMAKAEELGVPGNLKLAQYVLTLEYRIDQMDDTLQGVYNISHTHTERRGSYDY